MSENTELHEGVKLLIARMESHPEEFTGIGVKDMLHDSMYNNRWTRVLSVYWEVLTEYEKATITTTLREANRKNFHSAVMKTILAPDEETLRQRAMAEQARMRIQPQQLELPGMLDASSYALGAISGVPLTSYNTIK